MDFENEFLLWLHPMVSKELSIDAVFEGDAAELDSDTRSFPVYWLDAFHRKLSRGRRMLRLTGFRQGEVRRVRGYYVPKEGLNLSDMPLVHPLTVADLAALISAEPFYNGSLVLIYSKMTHRVYLCTSRSYDRYSKKTRNHNSANPLDTA